MSRGQVRSAPGGQAVGVKSAAPPMLLLMSTTARALRGPYKPGIARRLQVVKAAVDVFGQHGFKGGTLQQVAERVGVTPAAIEKLFGSKEQLLIAVLEHWTEETIQVIGPETRGLAHLDAFRKLMKYHTRHKGMLELYIQMAAEATSPNHPARPFMIERFNTTLADMRHIFEDGMVEGAFRSMTDDEIANEAAWLLATMDGLEIQYLLNPKFDLVGSFDRFVSNLVERLAPEPQLSSEPQLSKEPQLSN
jgi:AcrR family transcriptional regulator